MPRVPRHPLKFRNGCQAPVLKRPLYLVPFQEQLIRLKLDLLMVILKVAFQLNLTLEMSKMRYILKKKSFLGEGTNPPPPEI